MRESNTETCRLSSCAPLIVDVKRDSLEDGPGIRSVVFFKGCPLRCVFCHNPETQRPGIEIGFFQRDCIGCGECLRSCPRSAVDLDLPGRIIRERCDCCGLCVEACPGTGLRRVGKRYSVDELVTELLRDYLFYFHSGGGVTLSGGECTLYPDYLERLLTRLKASGIHTAIETSGYFQYDLFQSKTLPYLDLIYFDFKPIDPTEHMKCTGRSNEPILANFRRLVTESRAKLVARVPLVPGITATEENLSAVCAFLRECGATRLKLLPYNPMGLDKYESLGRERPDLPDCFMSRDEVEEARRFVGEGFPELMEDEE